MCINNIPGDPSGRRGVIYDDLYKGCSRWGLCCGRRLRLVIAAGNETAIILGMVWQHIVAQNFMLRTMRLMRMQSARR